MEGQQGLGAMNETRFAQFRHYVHNANVLLGYVGVVTIVLSVIGLVMVADEVFGDMKGWSDALFWAEVAIILYCPFLLVYTQNFRNIDNAVPGGVDNNYPNHIVMLKATGKTLALGIFTMLDSTLKERNGLWVVLFCSCFYLHLVHLMVIFQLTEDYDIAGGFLAASFGLLYEMIPTLWYIVPLGLGASILSSYKSLLIEGVGPVGPG